MGVREANDGHFSYWWRLCWWQRFEAYRGKSKYTNKPVIKARRLPEAVADEISEISLNGNDMASLYIK